MILADQNLFIFIKEIFWDTDYLSRAALVQCDRRHFSQASFCMLVLSPRPGYTVAEWIAPSSRLRLSSIQAMLVGP